MRIKVTVRLDEGETFAYSADQAASQVIAALGGNPANDYCQVKVAPISTGSAGAAPESPSGP